MGPLSQFGITTCPGCYRTVEVVGTQVQKHVTRIGGGAVEVCAMSGMQVDALKLQPVLSFRAKPKKHRLN